MQKKAAIDLGTNTCLLLVAEVDGEGNVIHVLEDQSRIVRLGEGVDASGELQPEAIERTRAALKEYAGLVTRHGILPQNVVAVATASARDAKNGGKFFDSIEKAHGFNFRTLTGGDEAKFTFLGGVLPGMDSARTAVIDIGGGSTEFRDADHGVSLNLGSVRFTERFLHSDPVTDEEFWACQEAADALLEPAQTWRKNAGRELQLVGVAGTVVNLACLQFGITEFSRERLDGVTLERGDVHRLVEELKWRSREERRAMPGLEAKRADVILAGALILWRAMELLDFRTLTVSTRGLRYGVIGGSA